MKHVEDSHHDSRLIHISRWQLVLTQATVAFAGACSGVVLYKSLFPSFYYLDWIFFMPMLWGLVSLAYILQSLALWVVATGKRGTLLSSPPSGLVFIVGMLVLVSLFVGFKVPLRASFLLAKPDFEDAVATYSDDLDQIGLVSYRFGIYPISRAHRGCHKKDRIYFQFSDDAESAIIYSESGIDDLCYNSGSKGRLFGNWYWMKED